MIPFEIPTDARRHCRERDWKAASKIEWDAEDWCIFYHCISFAFYRIARRDRSKKQPAIDFQI